MKPGDKADKHVASSPSFCFFFLDLTLNMLKGIFMEQDCKSYFRWFQFISWIIHLFLLQTVKKMLNLQKKCLFWIMFATASPVLTSCQICPITRCICVFADAEIFSESKGLCLLLTGIKYTDQAHAFFLLFIIFII